MLVYELSHGHIAHGHWYAINTSFNSRAHIGTLQRIVSSKLPGSFSDCVMLAILDAVGISDILSS